MKMIDGGVTAAKGFLAAGGAAGIKKNGSDDMAIIYAEVPCVSAGTFTTNRVKAAQRSGTAAGSGSDPGSHRKFRRGQCLHG